MKKALAILVLVLTCEAGLAADMPKKRSPELPWSLIISGTSSACFVQDWWEPEMGYREIGKYATLGLVCQDALDNYDPDMENRRRCWSYSQRSVALCAGEGITLPSDNLRTKRRRR